ADGVELPYDGLVIATGSRPRQLPGAGSVVHVVRRLSDSRALQPELVWGRHLVILGARFVGLEIAATAREIGMDVTVCETAPAPLARVLGTVAGDWFTAYHRAHGVSIRCQARVERIEPGRR